MARIEKRLLVTTRATIDGVTGLSDANGEPVFTTSIMPVAAERRLNSINGKRPNGMKHKIEHVDYDTVTRQIVSADDVAAAADVVKKAPAKKSGGSKAKGKKDDPFDDESGDVTL